jgi:hypothetical protein
MRKSSFISSSKLSDEQAARLERARERYPAFSEVEEFLERISNEDPLLVLLFGSLATGEFTQHSDADMLVIFEGRVDWMKVYESSAGHVQPFVRSMEEAIQEIAGGSTFLIEALEDGIPLFDRADTYGSLKRAAEEAKARLNLKREGTGWRRVSKKAVEG